MHNGSKFVNVEIFNRDGKFFGVSALLIYSFTESSDVIKSKQTSTCASRKSPPLARWLFGCLLWSFSNTKERSAG